jgi:hypothetical protein
MAFLSSSRKKVPILNVSECCDTANVDTPCGNTDSGICLPLQTVEEVLMKSLFLDFLVFSSARQARESR